MKIIFIEPRSPNLHIFSRFGLPRLGTVLMATIARRLGHEASVYIEEIRPVDWEDVRSADLVGISSITSTAPRAYAMADKIRQRGGTVVMGGPHVTFLPEEAAEHADFVLKGEAEHSFPELLEHLESRRPVEAVHNLVRLDGEKAVHGPEDGRIVDIRLNPHPDFRLIRGFRTARSLARVRRRIIPVQLSRGCPFDCSFCSVTGMFGRTMRYRDTDDIMSELLTYNSKDVHIFFYDDNFTANRSRAKELLRAMKAAGTRFVWSTQVRVDAAKDPELLRLMRDTRCEVVYIGIESADPRVLEHIRKRQTVGEAGRGLNAFRRHGIPVHGMFILGLDTDTPAVIDGTVRFARRTGLTSLQALILTPLPGTRVFDRLKGEGRILFHDWSMYDAHHVVFSHPVMSPGELQQAQIDVHNRFYSRGRVVRDLLRGRVGSAGIAVYARGLNRRWKGRNSLYLHALKLLQYSRELEVTMDLRIRCTV
ncbi:B12-binding domain-containing radical SAM protein [Thermodesulfobacteriota bacterium]